MKYLNRYTILGALGVAALLLILTLLLGFGSPVTQTEGINMQLAAITIIPVPTSTLKITAIPTYDPAQGTPTPQAGEISLNGYVQIIGTNGEGLRLRETPGLNGKHLFLGFDSEIFQVVDGPEEADGYIWWYILAPYDNTRIGWAASDFLEAVTSP